jgi:hypothetical protein
MKLVSQVFKEGKSSSQATLSFSQARTVVENPIFSTEMICRLQIKYFTLIQNRFQLFVKTSTIEKHFQFEIVSITAESTPSSKQKKLQCGEYK